MDFFDNEGTINSPIKIDLKFSIEKGQLIKVNFIIKHGEI